MRWPLAGLLAGVLVLALGPLGEVQALGRTGGEAAGRPAGHARHPREKTYLKRKWGVEVMFVRQTAAGYMLEFRYKVLDAEKAKPLFDRQTKPVLQHARTGATLIVPTPAKTGALRSSNAPLAGHVYWMFFANPGKLVKPGEQVTVEIGQFRAEGLVVQ